MEKYNLFAKINVEGNEKYYMFAVEGNERYYMFASDNLYEMLEKIVELYKNGYSVELFIYEEDMRESESGKSSDASLNSSSLLSSDR